jgi:hypothetical protein
VRKDVSTELLATFWMRSPQARTTSSQSVSAQSVGALGRTAHGFRSSFRDWAGNETLFLRELAEHALAFYRNGEGLFYAETVHDKRSGKVVSSITSVCNGGQPDYSAVPPPQAPAAPSPSVSLPDRNVKKFLDCVEAAAIALARVSSEPAQTIVDAAIVRRNASRLRAR